MRLAPALPLLLALGCAANEPPDSDAPVGPRAEGGHVLPTHQLVEPAGRTIAFDGRPLDLVLSPDGRFVFVKEEAGVLTLDAQRGAVASRWTREGFGASMHGLARTRAGDKLYVTGTKDQLLELAVAADGSLELARTLALPAAEVGGEPYPCGIALAPDESSALVCLSRGNALALVDLREWRTVASIAVGVAPYDVVLAPDGKLAYVSNFGGRRAAAGERSAASSGTQILVDERGIGASGTLSVVDVPARSVVAELECGLHPSDLELARDGARLYVAAANSDAVFVVDTGAREVVERIGVKPDATLPFGSLVNALALSADERTLYAANGGNNALAVVRLGQPSSVAGFVPTGAFPGAIALRDGQLFVANVKGEGSRARKAGEQGWHSPNERGSVSCIGIPDAAALGQWTERALANARVPQARRTASERARSGVAPRPVPRRAGEPSAIEHVVYVIKENRTYDQVFGDLPQGDGDPSLCVFGREVTPNQHALAERFVLLDNYYCNGVVSADGHQWATQGVAVDYLEKQFGGWTRGYDLGTDALTYASNGFLWDAVLLRGLSFRNYGELDFTRIDEPRGSWYDVQRAVREGRFRSSRSLSPELLARYSAPGYPGWNMKISDQLRVDRFLEEFRAMERTGEFPDFVIVYLPQDHTSGQEEDAPTPRAHVADNDLAVGRLIESLSQSRFWPTMAVFVNEDDPQNGWDHVDGHRSTCLVASPWAKRGARVSSFHNQTSVLRTMELILGLPPLSQQDAAARPMDDCFAEAPDLEPFRALPNRVPLDERNPRKSAPAAAQDLSRPDRIDDDAFNRVIWASVRGDEPYPSAFAGAHGQGLVRRGLKLADLDEEDDD